MFAPQNLVKKSSEPQPLTPNKEAETSPCIEEDQASYHGNLAENQNSSIFSNISKLAHPPTVSLGNSTASTLTQQCAVSTAKHSNYHTLILLLTIITYPKKNFKNLTIFACHEIERYLQRSSQTQRSSPSRSASCSARFNKMVSSKKSGKLVKLIFFKESSEN